MIEHAVANKQGVCRNVVAGQPLEQFCSALLSAMRTGDARTGIGSSVFAELSRIVGDGVQKLGSELRDELETLDATVSHLKSLSNSKLCDPEGRTSQWLAELTLMRQSAAAMVQAFEVLEASTGGRNPHGVCLRIAESPVETGLSRNAALESFESSIANLNHELPTEAAETREDSVYPLAESAGNGETLLNQPTTTETLVISCNDPPDERAALAYCKQADVWRRHADFVQAEAYCDEAIRLDPQCRNAFSLRGLVYLQAGENDYAIDDFTVVLGMNEDDAEVFSLRGDAQARAGRFQQAVSDYRRALDLQPALHKTRLNLGMSLRRLGQWSDGSAEFTRVLESWPDHAPSYFQRGMIHLERDSFPEAIADLQAAVRYKSDYPEAREHLRAAIAHQREVEKASQTKAAAAPAVNTAAPALSDKVNRVPVQCPGCGTVGLLNWNRTDKVVICQQCRRSFGIRPDGKAVEVVRSGDGRWVDLQGTLDRQKQSRRRWMARTALAACALPLLGASVWKISRPTKQLAANELPKDLKRRAELFASAWLRNDVPLMRRLTTPNHDRLLYGWYNKHRPPITRAEGIRGSLPKNTHISVTSQTDQTGWSRVAIHFEGLEDLGGTSSSADLPTAWQELGDTWFFEPSAR